MRPRWALMMLAYGLLIVAWAFASPPGARPDEPASVIRAAAVGTGQWLGRPVASVPADPTLTPAQAEFRRQQAREFTIPAGLVPPPACFAFAPEASAACLNRERPSGDGEPVAVTSAVGAYPPFVYLPAGLAMRTVDDWVRATYAGRLALGLVCTFLLGAAAWLLGARASLWSLTGLALAATPMVVSLASEVSPSGVEACAAICFAAALIAVWQGEPRGGAIAILAVSGTLLALTRPLGMVEVAALFLATLPLVTARRLASVRLPLALLVIVAAVVVAVWWAQVSQPYRVIALAPVTGSLGHVLSEWPGLLQQQIGVFGWLDTTLPGPFYSAWGALLVMLLAAAVVVGAWRERLVLLLAVAGTVVFGAAVYGLVLAPAWDLQGRYLLPVLVLAPLAGGWALQRAALRPRGDTFLVGLLAGVLQFVAFWYNARRYAVGTGGSLFFLDHPEWAPPAGWLPWVVIAGLGALLLAWSLTPLTFGEREVLDEADWRSRLVLSADRVSITR